MAADNLLRNKDGTYTIAAMVLAGGCLAGILVGSAFLLYPMILTMGIVAVDTFTGLMLASLLKLGVMAILTADIGLTVAYISVCFDQFDSYSLSDRFNDCFSSESSKRSDADPKASKTKISTSPTVTFSPASASKDTDNDDAPCSTSGYSPTNTSAS